MLTWLHFRQNLPSESTSYVVSWCDLGSLRAVQVDASLDSSPRLREQCMRTAMHVRRDGPAGRGGNDGNCPHSEDSQTLATSHTHEKPPGRFRSTAHLQRHEAD